jgi:protein-L-isoaspartate(D-aspartate) O-methyltransferase
MRYRWNFLIALIAMVGVGCQRGSDMGSDTYDLQRRHMIRWDLKEKGIKSEAVLNAMQVVPRHLFVPAPYRADAYKNEDVPIGHFVTTPNPFVVARTIELLNLKPTDRILEVGTGSAYQTALLAELGKDVYTIEIVPEISKAAEKLLKQLNYRNVHCRTGDGYKGWPEAKPFDAILISAAVKEVPGPLQDQLAMGGRLVTALEGSLPQKLALYRKTPTGLKKEIIMEVNLARMEGKAANLPSTVDSANGQR